MTEWDWPESKRRHNLVTAEDFFFASYAMLSISRQIMVGRSDHFDGGRTKWANIEMSNYRKKRKNISTLDRDDRLAQDGDKVCSHCGTRPRNFHWDHLIPKSKLAGEYLALNQVRSCEKCNVGRGNNDLMKWHRRNRTFPSLSVLRRYIKLCYFYAQRADWLTLDVTEAIKKGMPFDPRHLPRRFPTTELLVWDYAYPQMNHTSVSQEIIK